MNIGIYKSKMKPFKDTYVMYQLLEFIDESSIICLCKTSKKLIEIYEQYIEIEDDRRFEVNIGIFIVDNNVLLEKLCMNNDVIKIRKLIKMNIELSWGDGLYGACFGGHIDLAKFMIEKGADNWNRILDDAYKSGHRDMTELIIQNGLDDWNFGLYGACFGGHMATVQLMIETGAKDLNCGLEGACEGGHIDIAKLMIDKGATKCGYCGRSMEEHLSDKK